MRKAGGDDSKVKFVELAFPDMPAALGNKQVDAAWIVEPFLTIAKEQGAKAIAWNLVDTAPNLMIAVYFTSGKYAHEHADTVKRFTAAMNESLAYADTHADEVRAIVPTYTRISKELIGKLTLPRWPTEMNRKSTETLANFRSRTAWSRTRSGRVLPLDFPMGEQAQDVGCRITRQIDLGGSRHRSASSDSRPCWS